MPLDPEYNRWTAGGTFSILSGAEYQSYSYGIFHDFSHNKNVPCAVCFTRGSALMIPAKRTCPTGWEVEYEGIKSLDKFLIVELEVPFLLIVMVAVTNS